MSRPRAVLLALVLGVAAATVIGMSGTRARAAAPSTPTRLTLNQPTATRAQGILLLSATLATQDGRPLSNRPVAFYQQVDLFGARSAHLGTATTDATGTAALTYQPAEAGLQTIRARFAGGDGYDKAEASTTFTATEVVPPFQLEPEPLPFAALARWLPLGVGVLVTATWAVLLGVVLSTLLGMRRAARLTTERPAPALAPAHTRVNEEVP